MPKRAPKKAEAADPVPADTGDTGKRAGNVACVRRINRAQSHLSYCGRQVTGEEWAFFSPDHAVESGIHHVKAPDGQSRVVCAQCRKIITQALAGKAPQPKPAIEVRVEETVE